MSACPCPDPTELPWSLCWFLAQLVFNRQLSVGISTLHCEVIPAGGIQQGIQGYSYNSFGLAKLNPRSGHHTGNNLCAALPAKALDWNGWNDLNASILQRDNPVTSICSQSVHSVPHRCPGDTMGDSSAHRAFLLPHSSPRLLLPSPPAAAREGGHRESRVYLKTVLPSP